MPLWALRPYQELAVQTLIQSTRSRQFLLLQAATGAGKTLMAAHFMRYFTDRWHFRCLFLAHKAILVRQALERMQTSFEDADVNVDCLCASVEKPGSVSGHIIVASPQTLGRRLENLPRTDVIVIDECHRVPPKDQHSLYGDIINAVIEKRPNARILGITATPWRLGQGPIYSQAGQAQNTSWWSDLDVRISIRELQESRWLAPLTVLACDTSDDLLSVPVGASGDFREDVLEETLLKPLHLGSAVKAVQTHAMDRKHIAAFCVSIVHARALAERFAAQGISAAAIDSRTDARSNNERLAAFARGEIRVLCTVGMLTEGWDCPATDCLLMCRPTLSPALYVQMVGRGLRTERGKKDCLLLDLSGNVLRHGSPNAPKLSRPQWLFTEEGGSGQGNSGESPRFCPFCDSILPADTKLECPVCHASLYELTEDGQAFRAINLDRLEKLTQKGEACRKAKEEAESQRKAEEKAREEAAREARARHKAQLINHGEPVRAQVLSWSRPEPHQVHNGPAAGAMVLKFELIVHIPGTGRRAVRILLDPEGAMGRRARTCFWVLQDTKTFWQTCSSTPFPTGKAGLLAKWPSVSIPQEVTLRESSGGFLRIIWKEKAKKKRGAGTGPKAEAK